MEMTSADISRDRRYRYELVRGWDASKPYCLFIMLNPSTADEVNDDPTIRRVTDYAKRWGYGGVIVLNLFSFRTPDPKKLEELSRVKEKSYLVGFFNDAKIHFWSEKVDKVILAWGNHGKIYDRSDEIVKKLSERGIPMYALTVTEEDEPGHPLYLKAELEPFEVEVL